MDVHWTYCWTIITILILTMNETLILAETVPFLIPLFEKVRLIIMSLQWMMGGIFGLYLILIILRWRESVAVKNILKV